MSNPTYFLGSIPACAGEPRHWLARSVTATVYPRVCGGTRPDPAPLPCPTGLSPRVRGNLWTAARRCRGTRSIPACAGEPKNRRRRVAADGVYPRVCGGTHQLVQHLVQRNGLSPRVRGNPRRERLLIPRRGSIPACAGEPRTARGPRPVDAVYPRVCGGTRSGGAARLPWLGLSPRVRGNHFMIVALRFMIRSIPACAGEPAGRWRRRSAPGVYPRVCGGTVAVYRDDADEAGLSPRVRGNRCRPRLRLYQHGSIPACAGEPPGNGLRGWAAPVYPRVCGGTAPGVLNRRGLMGLSPRVRGNRHDGFAYSIILGSIPACAGEPGRRRPRKPLSQVYPRVCGGTGPWRLRLATGRGLSPRVRGNLMSSSSACIGLRSIPACAGEPRYGQRQQPTPAVYPRVCGGTLRRHLIQPPVDGLSPRVRGNLTRWSSI